MDACSRATFIDDGQRWEIDILGDRVLRGVVLGYLSLFNFKFPSYQNACVDFVSQNKKNPWLVVSHLFAILVFISGLAKKSK